MLIRPDSNIAFGLPLAGPQAQPSDTGGGGEGAYVAKAVHLDGTFMMSCPALTAIDNQFFSASFFYRSTGGLSGPGMLFVSDPNGAYANDLDCRAGFIPSWDFGNSDDSLTYKGNWAADATPAVYHHVAMTFDTNHPNGEKIAVVYVDGVLIPSAGSGNANEVGDAFMMAFNGLQATIGDDGFGTGVVGDFADLWIAPGVSLLTGSVISDATIAKFRDPITGKPVDLGADGSTPTGSAPAIFFSGDATGFVTNKGTGGDFSVVAGTLTNATTSPSD